MKGFLYICSSCFFFVCINCNRLCQKIDYKSWIELNSFSWAQRMSVCMWVYLWENFNMCSGYGIFWRFLGFMLTCFNNTQLSYTRKKNRIKRKLFAVWAELSKKKMEFITWHKQNILSSMVANRTEKYDDYWML